MTASGPGTAGSTADGAHSTADGSYAASDDRGDASYKHRASQWLATLAELLLQSTCRRRGESVPLEEGLAALARLWAAPDARDSGRSVRWIGNGGSAALVSHISQDLLNACEVRSHTFNDAPLITCMSNDYGYEQVFKRPLAVVGRAGDVLMAVSSSGMSQNIVEAAQLGLEMGMTLVTFSAFSPDNSLNGLGAELAFHTPTRVYGHAELAHEAMLHSALDLISQPRA